MQNERGFFTVRDEATEDAEYIQTISRLSGLHSSQVSIEEITRALTPPTSFFEEIMAGRALEQVRAKYFAKLGPEDPRFFHLEYTMDALAARDPGLLTVFTPQVFLISWEKQELMKKIPLL